MRISYDFNNIMARYIGDKYGVCEDEINLMDGTVFKIMRNMRTSKEGFMNLPYDTEQLNKINDFYKKVKNKFENVIVLGIGGSALGGKALVSLLKPSYYNLLEYPKREYPRIFFYDNVDTEELSGLLSICDLRKTLVNVITKSGSTVETMSAFLIIKNKLKKILGKNYINNIVITTDSDRGELRNIAIKEKISSFSIPSTVGGRFSVLSPVGLLPAKLAGIDIEAILAGARFMDKICLSDQIWKNPAAISATLHHNAFINKEINMIVMMPYTSKFKDITDWFRQLWAESIGKKYAKDGSVVETGSTPISALGVTDQHSQLQLYMEGPHDKIITFIHVKKFNANIKIPEDKNIELKYLGKYTLNELMETEWVSTEYSLTKEKRPNATIHIPEINEFTIGQFIYLLEMKTAIAGELFQINAFDQPGVEAGKNFMYGILNRSGYENKKSEFLKRQKKTKMYII
ncbi:MAG: glucose-6-phosphate isomerase [Candidatus Firestonebacteria bacterium]|nr:glucose-6-phosphate isomerase [Candidatus Firestonebacteria bacterium]